MKCILILVAFNLALITRLYPQTIGVYLNQRDFENGKVTSLDLSDSLVSLVENYNGSVTLSAQQQIRSYNFDDIFGYLKNDVKYRKYGSRKKLFTSYGFCEVLDESALIIYSKPARHHRSGGYIWHYYSKSPTSDIKLITLKNLKNDFADNPEFIDVMSRSIKRKYYLRQVNGRMMINEVYISKTR